MTNSLQDEMRAWLLECFSSDDDQEEIESLTYHELENAISRYFDGGMKGFIESCAPIKVPGWQAVEV